jgi:hypothetical protein
MVRVHELSTNTISVNSGFDTDLIFELRVLIFGLKLKRVNTYQRRNVTSE